MHQCHTYCCLLRSSCFFSSHNAIYSPLERAHCVTRAKNGCERDYPYYRSSNREKIKLMLLIKTKLAHAVLRVFFDF